MSKNGYFQLNPRDNKLFLSVVPPEDGGSMFEIEELIHYLDIKRITKYDLASLNNYLKSGNYKDEYIVAEGDFFQENEEMLITIQPKALSATLRFYPPSAEGSVLSKEEIVRTIRKKGVVHGVMENVVDDFLTNRCYCTDYVVAKATMPTEGSDAKVEYHFDTNVSIRPKLNEDGSVDFHQLGHIKPVRPGDKLATLYPADLGKPGTNVIGGEIKPKKVRIQRLHYGRNIELSENRQEIFSKVAGHVTLVDDMVFVSDVYQVPKNVDASTGDIEYSGSVEIPGNVLTGYAIKADGDVIVNGVVEGAHIVAGGNIILKNGMQGMSRGRLEAKGNIVAKYLENCTVIAGGSVMSDAMMHTDVTCKDRIEVSGRKGLITGGHLQTYGNIIASNLGSSMGTDTKIEILADTEMAKKANQLEKEADEKVKEVRKLDQILVALSTKIKSGDKLTAEQENSFKLVVIKRKEMVEELNNLNFEVERLQERLAACKDVSIKINGNVYSGVKIIIKDIMKIMRENVSHCKFVREGADIRMTSF